MMNEMKLGEARALVADGRLDAIQIAGLDGWPDDVRLVVTLPDASDIVSPVAGETATGIESLSSEVRVSDIVSLKDANVDASTTTGSAEGSDPVQPDAAQSVGN